MGGKIVFMGRDIQTDIYDLGSISGNTREYSRTRQPDGTYFYSYHRNNRYKVAEGFKLLNFLGLTTYIIGILANINNLLSVLLALVGIVWVVLKCLEKNEDWRLKKWEREQREKEYEERKKRNKRA